MVQYVNVNASYEDWSSVKLFLEQHATLLRDSHPLAFDFNNSRIELSTVPYTVLSNPPKFMRQVCVEIFGDEEIFRKFKESCPLMAGNFERREEKGYPFYKQSYSKTVLMPSNNLHERLQKTDFQKV